MYLELVNRKEFRLFVYLLICSSEVATWTIFECEFIKFRCAIKEQVPLTIRLNEMFCLRK